MPRHLEQVLELCIPHLDSIHDLHSLLCSSRSLNSIIHSFLSPSSLLAILLRTSWTDRQTSEWLIFSYIASCFPQLLQNESHRRAFKRSSPAFPHGSFHLALANPLRLSSCTPKFTLRNVGKTWEKRKEILVGLTDLIDNCVGEQWYAVPDFWDGGREDAATLFGEANMSALQLVVYGEMWGGEVRKAYDHYLGIQQRHKSEDTTGTDLSSNHGPTVHSNDADDHARKKYQVSPEFAGCEVSLRAEWVKYAMPDWHTTLPLGKSHKPSGISSSYPSSPVHSPASSLHTSLIASSVEPDQGSGGGGEGGVTEETDDTTISQFNPNGPIPIEEYRQEQQDHPDSPLQTPTHIPSIHPLRQVRDAGPFLGHMHDLREEHVTVMLHLLQVSPLWARITKTIRRRAIRLALDRSTPQSFQEDGDGAIATEHTVEKREVGSVFDTQEREKRVVEEFGKTIRESEWDEAVSWKQILWEDALWTSGWDGMEVIADAWEYDQENTKAVQRRQRRLGDGIEITKENGEHPGSENNRDGKDKEGRIPDDHPALQRLVKIYRQLDTLETEPRRVTLRSITRPGRKGVNGWMDVPCFLGDLRLVAWNDNMGMEWEVK